jgi:CBS domain-containing protein
MDITSIMTGEPARCTRDTPLPDVARLMREHDCGAIPVIEDETTQRPIGIVTDRDIVVRLVAEGRDPTQATAGDAYSVPVVSVTASATLADACHLMETRKLRRIVVVDDQGRLCGMLALADVALSGFESTTVEVVKEVSEPA